MRGKNIIVQIAVIFGGKLTPRRLASIGAKLDKPPIQNLAVQVRKHGMKKFSLDLGDGITVTYPLHIAPPSGTLIVDL